LHDGLHAGEGRPTADYLKIMRGIPAPELVSHRDGQSGFGWIDAAVRVAGVHPSTGALGRLRTVIHRTHALVGTLAPEIRSQTSTVMNLQVAQMPLPLIRNGCTPARTGKLVIWVTRATNTAATKARIDTARTRKRTAHFADESATRTQPGQRQRSPKCSDSWARSRERAMKRAHGMISARRTRPPSRLASLVDLSTETAVPRYRVTTDQSRRPSRRSPEKPKGARGHEPSSNLFDTGELPSANLIVENTHSAAIWR